MKRAFALRRGIAPGPCILLVWALLLASTPSRAQDVPVPGPDYPEGPTLTRPEVTPFIFEPDINTVPAPLDISRTLNTPSGLSPFTDTRAMARGLQLTISEAIRFDDNVRRLASGAFVPAGRSKADVYSVTNLGATYARDFGLQTVFVQGDFGVTRYRRNTDLDNSRYRFAAGVNWQVGSPCRGSLVASTTQSEVEFQSIAIGAPPNALTKTERVDFQGRCHVFGEVYATFGAGISNFSINTNPLNDARRSTLRAGFEYAVPQLHTLGFETVYTHSDFTNRTSTPASPLTTELTQREYRGYYTYIVSPKTTINFSGGILQSTASTGFSESTQSRPVGSASINWRPTPKILVSLGGQIVASPSQSITADFQRLRVVSLSVLYKFSPKLNFSAAFAATRQTQSTLNSSAGIVVDQETRSQTFSLDANYQVSPFMFAGLGYRFSEQSDRLTRQKVTSNLYTVSLNYRR